jgi:phenylalanyl-tRNA synthetase beta chain
MRVPLKWFKEYVDIDVAPREIENALTMSGSKVEGITYLGEGIENVVVGQIDSLERHPNADSILVAKVNVGEKILTIQTGASNVKLGQKVPVALDGCLLPNGKSIKETEIRGIISQGMMCSVEELGLEPKDFPEEMREGIIILDDDSVIGEDVKPSLGLDDYVIEFEITSNRPDCLSVIGLAREVAATFGKKLKYPEIPKDFGEPGNIETSVEIVDSNLCPRYIAKIITDVKIGPSPLWLQNRIKGAGLRPINNVVDVTNYVMLELGQPLHAFDYHKLYDNRIIVRPAKDGEALITLDGIQRKLRDSNLVIADGKDPVAVAGVMGGEFSEVTENTKTILLESALFNNISIRRTAKQLGLRSDASSRFEKGIDPEGVKRAAIRAAQLIELIGAGKAQGGAVDVYPNRELERTVSVSVDRINNYIGVTLKSDEIKGLLNLLELPTEGEEIITVKVPSFRRDIAIEADIIEEVARMYGYDRIPPTLLSGVTTPGKDSKKQSMDTLVKDTLIGQGFFEIMTYSFVTPLVYDKISLDGKDPKRRVIKLMNPISEEHSAMRTTLIPNMLTAIAYNLNRRAEEIRLFELGNVYLPKELPLMELPDERKTLSLGLCGEGDFFNLKGIIGAISEVLGVEFNYKPVEHPTFHPYRCGTIIFKGEEIGIIGEVHPLVLEKYGISRRVILSEIDFEYLYTNANLLKMYKQLPRYPAVERDIAFIVSDNILAGDIKELIKGTSEYIESVNLFDIYKGEQVDSGHKSMAYSITFLSRERTLTDIEVKEMMEKIRTELTIRYKAKFRE